MVLHKKQQNSQHPQQASADVVSMSWWISNPPVVTLVDLRKPWFKSKLTPHKQSVKKTSPWFCRFVCLPPSRLDLCQWINHTEAAKLVIALTPRKKSFRVYDMFLKDLDVLCLLGSNQEKVIRSVFVQPGEANKHWYNTLISPAIDGIPKSERGEVSGTRWLSTCQAHPQWN